MGGGEGALGGGADEEEAAAGRPGRPTAATGTGRTWVSAGQSRWAGPLGGEETQTHAVLVKGQVESSSPTTPLGLKRPNSGARTDWGRDAADWIVLPAEHHRARWDLLRGGARREDGWRPRGRHRIRDWSGTLYVEIREGRTVVSVLCKIIGTRKIQQPLRDNNNFTKITICTNTAYFKTEKLTKTKLKH